MNLGLCACMCPVQFCDWVWNHKGGVAPIQEQILHSFFEQISLWNKDVCPYELLYCTKHQVCGRQMNFVVHQVWANFSIESIISFSTLSKFCELRRNILKVVCIMSRFICGFANPILSHSKKSFCWVGFLTLLEFCALRWYWGHVHMSRSLTDLWFRIHSPSWNLWLFPDFASGANF